MGVDNFYITNHLSADNYLEVLQPYIDKGIVKITDLSGEIVKFNTDLVVIDASILFANSKGFPGIHFSIKTRQIISRFNI